MSVSSVRGVAARMSTIGTEGAFAVSARARALTAKAPSVPIEFIRAATRRADETVIGRTSRLR